MAQDWRFWRLQLSGDSWPETTPGKPWAGFYKRPFWRSSGKNDGKRVLDWEGIAIWFDETAGWQCLRHGPFGDGRSLRQDEIDQDVFAWAARCACSVEEFWFHAAHGRWPNEDETPALWSE